MGGRWSVSGRALVPDGYNDQGYWTGDSTWQMIRMFLRYRRLGWVVTVVWHTP